MMNNGFLSSVLVWRPSLTAALLLFYVARCYAAPFSYEDTVSEQKTRGPPPNHMLSGASGSLLTDQTQYVNIGDEVGSVIAVGDFTSDRYTDLLVSSTMENRRSVRVLIWDHHKFAFQAAKRNKNSTFGCHFSLDAIKNLSPAASIGSASTLDANADGLLDVLLSVRVQDARFVGVLLLGNGSGCFQAKGILPGVTPGALIMDANDDMIPDIFFISIEEERTFYINNQLGSFVKRIWRPRDIDGDCLPDLVVSTSCGLEVWFNSGLRDKPVSRWMVGQEFRKEPLDISNRSWSEGKQSENMMLHRSIWEDGVGDGRATFADFNGDGTIDIGVANSARGELRISYNVRKARTERLCLAALSWHFRTEVALENFRVADVSFGKSKVQNAFHVGDFNFDGKADVLAVDAETGTLNLFEAHSTDAANSWFRKSPGLWRLLDRLFFSLTGMYRGSNADELNTVFYKRYAETSLLNEIEDPLGAAFFDLDESGRQDIIILQSHGTRLLWNAFKEFEDSLFFKATAVNSAQRASRSSATKQAFSPLPGSTFKLTYCGRYGREVHSCSQCSQTGFLSLQSCSCVFGIPNIANYIEEVAMGGATGVRTWKNLMPNAMAVVQPQRRTSQKVARWKISYLSRGRYGQMKRVVIVLIATLGFLSVAIMYVHYVERLNERYNKFDMSCS